MYYNYNFFSSFFFCIAFTRSTICVLTDSCTGKEERILYTNFKNTDPQKYDYVQSVRYFFMVMEYLMVTHGTFDGVIVTMNSKGINWRHITKTPMGTLKKLLGFVQVRPGHTVFVSLVIIRVYCNFIIYIKCNTSFSVIHIRLYMRFRCVPNSSHCESPRMFLT